MENRRKLHESGVVMIIVGIFNLFMFISTIVDSILDGTVAEGLANVNGDILGAVKVGLVIVCVIMAFLVVADILIGVKAIKVSKNPTASRGYIIVAMVFCVMSCLAVISNAISVFSGSEAVLDAGLNVANTAFTSCAYAWLINAGEAVRKDVLNETK